MNGNTIISTRSSDLALLFATNSTRVGTAVAQPVDRTTPPITDTTANFETGVIDMAPVDSYSANGLKLFPFGTNTAAQTFLLALFGWDVLKGDQASIADLWHPQLLASFTCTLSASTGLAGTRINASQLYCGTIVVLAGNANVSCEALSPTGNVAACVRLDTLGARYVTGYTFLNASSASANAMWRRV
jgi:hypothetical protein